MELSSLHAWALGKCLILFYLASVLLMLAQTGARFTTDTAPDIAS